MRTVHAYFQDGESVSDLISLDPPIEAGEEFLIVAHRGPDQVPQGKRVTTETVNVMRILNPQAAWMNLKAPPRNVAR